jgi:nicotinate phosphoribosyltransferase
LTDHYELTMLDAALHAGVADRRCVFEVFCRRLPLGRRYGVVAGTERLLEAVRDFRFDDRALAFLERAEVVGADALRYLADYRFTGDIEGYREGEAFFPYSPILTVTGGFAETVVLETVILSILNHDCAIAAAASRMVNAANGRTLLEFGSRRTHEEAAVAAARAAIVAGFDATSNLEAGARYGLKTAGTAAHAWTLLFDDERDSFAAQVAVLGEGTTLLVDTYDIAAGIDNAIEVGGAGLGGIRIDSGHLPDEAKWARQRLDDADATGAKIVVSGDLDEYAIADLHETPIDGYGVGTRLVTGSGHPTANLVYKLVARESTSGGMESVEKLSPDKRTRGGHKRGFRRLGPRGRATAEIARALADGPGEGRHLTVPLVADGEALTLPGIDDIRSHHRLAIDELPDEARRLSDGPPCLPTEEASHE